MLKNVPQTKDLFKKKDTVRSPLLFLEVFYLYMGHFMVTGTGVRKFQGPVCGRQTLTCPRRFEC